MMMASDLFFNDVVPKALKRLQPEQVPDWGEMGPAEMLHHLIVGMEMCYNGTQIEIEVPQEKWPAAKAYLMSEKPMPKNFPKPQNFHQFPYNQEDLEALKGRFQEVLNTFLIQSERPDFSCAHPQFAILDGPEARQLARKHITHHFTQFQLL
jgi:hypothetical protein